MEYEVTAPDGRRFVVTAPPGASQDDVLRYAQQNMGAPGPQRSAMESAGRVAGQFGAGVNQGIANVVGAPFDLVNRGLRAVGVPIPQGSVAGTIQRGFDATLGPAPQPENTMESLARGAGGGLVDAATIATPAAGISRATQAVGQAPGLVNRAATALASQPALQAASGMVGGAVGEATNSPLLGAAAAFATPLAAGLMGRAVTPIRSAPNPQRDALVAAARREGIPMTAGQVTGSRFLQNVESQLEQMPFTSNAQRALREDQQRAITRASLRRGGVNADNAGPDVLAPALRERGQAIGDVANRNTLAVTPQLQADLAQIEDSLRFIPAEAAAPVMARIQQLRGMTMPNVSGSNNVVGTIPGASYRMMDSQLGRSMRSTSNGDLRAALGDLRERLRTAMDASISPEDAAEWARLRREYANLKVTQAAVSGAGEAAATGNVSPLMLRNAINRSTGGNYALGAGDQNELARLGQSVLRAPPDSGTAGRTQAGNLLTLSGGVGTGGLLGAAIGGPLGAAVGSAAGLATPRLAQMLMNTPLGQAYLSNRVVQNPAVTRSLAAALLGQQGVAQTTSP